MGDVLKEDLGLSDLDTVARSQLLAKNKDPVDHRAIAALEINNLVATLLALDLAVLAGAADVVNLNRILMRPPQGRNLMPNLKYLLMTVFSNNQLGPPADTAGVFILLFTAHSAIRGRVKSNQ